MTANSRERRIEEASRAWAMAAIGSATWDDAVAATAKGIQSEMGLMFSPGESWRARQVNGFLGAPREVTAEYASHWIHRDAWIQASASDPAFQLAGSIKTGSEVLSERDLTRTEFYNDFCREWGGHDIACMHVCDRQDPIAMPTYLSFFRSKREGLFDQSTRRFLRELWPHVQRSVKTYWRLEKARLAEVAEPGLLGPIPIALFVVRADGALDYANAEGLSFMRSLGGRGAGGRLLNTLPGMTPAEFKLALHQCAKGLSYGCAATVAQSKEAATRLRINFVPIAADPAYSLHWPHSCALIYVDEMDVAQDLRQRLDEFCVKNDLTKRETAVLALLMRGMDVPSIAEALGFGYATARTHVASILAKTGSARQTELIAKVVGIRPAP